MHDLTAIERRNDAACGADVKLQWARRAAAELDLRTALRHAEDAVQILRDAVAYEEVNDAA